MSFTKVDYEVEQVQSSYVLSQYDLFRLGLNPGGWAEEIEQRLLMVIEKAVSKEQGIVFSSTATVKEYFYTSLKKNRKWWGVGWFGRWVEWDEPVIVTVWRMTAKAIRNVKPTHIRQVQRLESIVARGDRCVSIAEATDWWRNDGRLPDPRIPPL